MDKTPSRLVVMVVALAVIVVLVDTGRAQAHTAAELDEWRVEWVITADESISAVLIGAWDDMRARHPWYFDPGVDHQHPTVRSRAWPASPAAIEQWRSLVAAYFPASEVDRALCVMGYETGWTGDPNSKNDRSSAAGLFQFLRDTWDRVPLSISGGNYDSGQVYKPEPNVASAAYLQARSGWWPWSPYKAGFCR